MIKKYFIHILLVSYIIVTLISTLYLHKTTLFTFSYWQKFPELKKIFFDSQYKNKNFKGFIPDEVAYSYAGGALIKGENPVLTIPEAPPLGKYLIGLSAIFFNNPNILITLVAGIAGVIMLFFLGKQVLHSSLLALLPVAFFVTEPLYKNQYAFVPLFDLAQLFFMLSAFYLFNRGILTKHKTFLFFALANVFVGFFISTKFYTSGIALVTPFMLVLFYNTDWKRMRSLIFTLWIPIAVLLSTYLRVFAFGYSVREFLGIQKWIFIYWQGALVMPFTMWDLLFFNRWHTWWDGNKILSDSQWHIGWPLITLISFTTIIFYFLKKLKRQQELEVLLFFVICYSAFLSVGTPVVRYFIILLPIMYIISIFFIRECFMYITKHKINNE